MAEQTRAVNRKQRIGTVVSDKGEQTVVVAVERATRHRLYRKVIRRTKKYHVHDPENAATTGDRVRIEECRPISKTKRWRLLDVLTERAVAEVAPESIDETLVDQVQRTAAHAAAADAEETEDAPPQAAPEAAAEAPAAEAAVAEQQESPAAAPTEDAAEETSAVEQPEAEAPADGAPASEQPEAEQADDEPESREAE